MKRPIGLRCGTTLAQPHRLMELLPCIAETSPDTMARSIMTLSVAQARCRPGCINELQSVLQAQVDEEMLLCPVKRDALAVLWASYNVQESGLSVASSLGEAAGLEGRHQWGLILPSSARVSLVTYQTVIAVRYPDLVHIDSGAVSYGMFFSADPGQAGGFLPIVWDVPGTDMEAADAIKVVTDYLRKRFEFGTEAADSLTVLHNRTNMVRVFGNSVTVKNSGGETRTRCVTSCAGSTAFLSVVAQTRRGFLSGEVPDRLPTWMKSKEIFSLRKPMPEPQLRLHVPDACVCYYALLTKKDQSEQLLSWGASSMAWGTCNTRTWRCPCGKSRECWLPPLMQPPHPCSHLSQFWWCAPVPRGLDMSL